MPKLYVNSAQSKVFLGHSVHRSVTKK